MSVEIPFGALQGGSKRGGSRTRAERGGAGTTGRLGHDRRFLPVLQGRCGPKLVPTWAEKLTWAPGDASQLRPVETELGRIGTLICGENTNPLARYALLAQGEQVHLSTYPPAWPSRRPGEARSYDLTRAIEIRAAAHAFEGKVFNIVSAGVLDDAAVQRIARVDSSVQEVLAGAPPPVSMILGPSGELCSERLEGMEGIVYGDIDVAESIEAKQFHDIVGQYQRFDLFSLRVDQRPQEPIVVVAEDGHEAASRLHPGAEISPELGEAIPGKGR
jgi:predicted amidohydrolase